MTLDGKWSKALPLTVTQSCPWGSQVGDKNKIKISNRAKLYRLKKYMEHRNETIFIEAIISTRCRLCFRNNMPQSYLSMKFCYRTLCYRKYLKPPSPTLKTVFRKMFQSFDSKIHRFIKLWCFLGNIWLQNMKISTD